MKTYPITLRGEKPEAHLSHPVAAPSGFTDGQAPAFAEGTGLFPACVRLLLEAPEFFQRKKAIDNARNLASNIERSFTRSLKATDDGYDNAEEQNESVAEASDQLRSAAALMEENIGRTQGIRVEWRDSFDNMLQLISSMRSKTGHTVALIDRLGAIQEMLGELGFQTNLSSLNAIVNAEQSGESGGIFAAVAEETRKASREIQTRIEEMMIGIRETRDSLALANEMFADLDRAIDAFKSTSDRIIAMAGEIVAASRKQEATLHRIALTVEATRHYTRSSKKRYRSIRSTKSEMGTFIDNINRILESRAGILGPCRLHKKTSLERQKRNAEGILDVASGNAATIQRERDDLTAQDKKIRDASSRLQRISDYSRTVRQAATDASGFLTVEVSGEMNAIAEQGRRFGDNQAKILALLRRVETIKDAMKKTVLFNDLLPLLANMAALLAEGKADLQIRATELDELIHKLQRTTDDIETFLEEAQEEVHDVSGLHRQMVSGFENNQSTAENITVLLGNIEDSTSRQSGQIEAVETALEVIRTAISANDNCADKITQDIRTLMEDIEAYFDLLNRRRD